MKLNKDSRKIIHANNKNDKTLLTIVDIFVFISKLCM